MPDLPFMNESMDRALGRLDKEASEARQREDQFDWAIEQAQLLAKRYARTLEIGGREPVNIVSPTYSRSDFRVRAGPWYSFSKRDEHKWSRSNKSIGRAWPIMPILGLQQVIRGRSVYDAWMPGDVSLPIVVFSDAGILLSAVVDHIVKEDMLDDSTGEAQFKEMMSSRQVLIDPKVVGTPCDDGYCGLPLWVSWIAGGNIYSSRASAAELRMRSTTAELRDEVGRTRTYAAPPGRGDEAYEWFLGSTVRVLDSQLKKMHLKWASA